MVFKSSPGDDNVQGELRITYLRAEFNEGTTYRDLGTVKETENGTLEH